MNHQQAMIVLGLQSACTDQEIESTYQRRMQALARQAKADVHNARLHNECRQVALGLQEAKEVLLRRPSKGALSRTPPQVRFQPRQKQDRGKPRPIAADSASPHAAEAIQEFSDLEPGHLLANRYDIRERIGSGTMGVVYSAFDRVRHETVAVKILRPELLADPRSRDRLRTEMKLASTLSHASIARVFDLHQADGLTFVTMEMLVGRSLRAELSKRLEDNRPFKVSEVFAWAAQLCDALEHAHGRMIHGNLKPENIWLSGDGSVKLMDFGFGRALANADAAKSLSSSREYAAPERRASDAVDGRADQYALAIVIHELLTGGVPTKPVVPVHKVRPGISVGRARVLLTAMSDDLERRFADMAAFRRAIVKKRMFSLPVRGLTTVVALALGFALTYPMWPTPARDRATAAREAALASRGQLQTLSADKEAELKPYGLPPTVLLAEAAFSAADEAMDAGDHATALPTYEDAARQWDEATFLVRQVLKISGGDSLVKYWEQFPDEAKAQNVPDALKLSMLREAMRLFVQARKLVERQDYADATESYQEAVESLEQASEQAKKLVRFWPDWQSLKEARQKAEAGYAAWRQLKEDWKKTLADVREFQQAWAELFADAGEVDKAFRALRNDVLRASPQDWVKLTGRLAETGSDFERRLEEARQVLDEVWVGDRLKSKATSTVQALRDMVNELDARPEETDDAATKRKLRARIDAILDGLGVKKALDALELRLSEANALAKSKPFKALTAYGELEREASAVLEGVKQQLEGAEVKITSSVNPFEALALEIDLPSLAAGPGASVELGELLEMNSALWTLSIRSNANGPAAARQSRPELGEPLEKGGTTMWPVLFRFAGTSGGRPETVGYVFIEYQRLKFRWEKSRRSHVEPQLMDLTLTLRYDSYVHAVRLRQITRQPAIPVELSQQESRVRFPLPVNVDARDLRLELLSIRGMGGAAGLPQTLTLGTKSQVYLDETRALFLDVRFREEGPEVALEMRLRLKNGDTTLDVTQHKMESEVADYENKLKLFADEIKEREQAIEDLQSQRDDLESEFEQAQSDPAGAYLVLGIRQRYANLEAQGRRHVTRISFLKSQTYRYQATLERFTAVRWSSARTKPNGHR